MFEIPHARREALWRLYAAKAVGPADEATFERALKDAAQAIANMPCCDCGTTAWPIVFRPPRESAAWWDDPGVYFACAKCQRYLGVTPVVPGWSRRETTNYPQEGFPPDHP